MLEDDVYTFTMRQSNGTTVSVSGCRSNLGDIIKDFEQWLLGCAFRENTIDNYLYHEACHTCESVNGLKINKCVNEKD